MDIAGFIAFLALVVAWVALPIKNGHLEAGRDEKAA